ncbi:RNA polymerase sigma factor [Bdellovibrio sp. NC01]|uniref:RNA polymerase sigma factor n=1 Tax=Bdellovibrio sp. NC01 TaxID=2220073 RepID=UPI001157F249|nr:sigma-70 family RNA polymerase sigma factor [Bdellovibrio sp. NC01]QDK36766.1 RNA polymerase subunit sigma [Bdellovibrio sp. NC01]
MERDLIVLSDLELVEKVKSGDRRSFSELVKRHQRSLLRLSLRFVKDMDVAEDVTQEAFIKAYEKLNSFEGRASFKSWLFQIGVNTARNKLREFKRDTVDVEDVHLAVEAEAEHTLVHTAVADILQKEVDKLPMKQKTALVLRVYEDLSFNEIAEIMECPYDTAKANYRHALMKLRQTFEQQEELKNWTEEVGGFFTEMNHRFAEAEG